MVSTIVSNSLTGSPRDIAKKLILFYVERRPGIRFSELQKILTSTANGITTSFSYPTFSRAVKDLVKEGKIEPKNEPGKKAIQYYIPGHQPLLVKREKPSELDRLILKEAYDLASEMLRSTLFQTDVMERIAPIKLDREVREQQRNRFTTRFLVLYNLIVVWERARCCKVPRPWINVAQDTMIDVGLSSMTEKDLKELNFITYIDWQPGTKGQALQIISPRFPSSKEQFDFLLGAIDTIRI